MILQLLRNLAEIEHLVDDPAFESKGVRWVVHLDAHGRFLHVYDTNQEPEQTEAGSKKKSRPLPLLMPIPRRLGRSSGIRADFLVDNAKYALGLAADSAEEGDTRVAECHAAFVQLLSSVRPELPELAATIRFLTSEDQLQACTKALEAQGGVASNDLFTFNVDGVALTEQPALMAWWGQRHRAGSTEGASAQCLVCGEDRIPARLHNSFQIRGASTSGVPLISFNAPAFEKYGLEGNENAPVCTDCMTAYSEALRRLTRAQYVTPAGKNLRPLSTVLNADTTAVFWADDSNALVQALPSFLIDPESVRNLLLSPQTGQHFLLRDPARFFCLVLSGTQGRVSVRRMHTSTVGEVAQNLSRYFRAIDVERYDSNAPLPLLRLLRSMVLNGERDRLPAGVATELWLHALFGGSLSRIFLATVVSRNRAERKIPAERAALLQLYFASRGEIFPEGNHFNSNKETRQPMSLDLDSKDPPYLLGRLLAVLERLQTEAQGRNLNRTLVDRTFGAASTRPGVVFPQLIQTAQHHLSKVNRGGSRSIVWLDKLLGTIIDGLDVNGFSAVLNLEEQGRFAIGYYHQRQSFFSRPAVESGAPASSNELTEETHA